MTKAFVYSIHGFDKPFLMEASKGEVELIFTEKALRLETVDLAKGFEVIAIFSSDDASAAVLEKLSQYGVKYITSRSAGYDHIDLNKANDLGIKVANVPEYSPYAIAEHGVAMLMALNRKMLKAQRLMDLDANF